MSLCVLQGWGLPYLSLPLPRQAFVGWAELEATRDRDLFFFLGQLLEYLRVHRRYLGVGTDEVPVGFTYTF